MNTTELKSSLLTLAQQNPADFLALIEEVVAQTAQAQDQRIRLEKVKRMILEDFDQYGDVFPKLA
ncbi:MAG: hypothetical protein OHK0039_29300 [Bacteroidia bacterium]